ncbi:MAG: hypothetical protein WC975_12585, partial [Phycisphaerae bacterium]
RTRDPSNGLHSRRKVPILTENLTEVPHLCSDFPPPPFYSDVYKRHILSSLTDRMVAFDDLPPLLDQERKDRVFRFITLVFLAHTRKIHLQQEGERIWVKRNEAYEQGSRISSPVEGTA